MRITTDIRQATTTSASTYRRIGGKSPRGCFSLGQKIWHCCWLFGFFSVAALAQDWQPQAIDQLRAAVASTWGPAAPEISVSFPQTGLNPPACEAWTIELPGGTRLLGRVSLRLRCPASGWSGWLPVQVRGTADVVVTRVAIQRGESLSADKLSVVRQDVTGESRPWYGDTALLNSAVSRRPLAAGTLVHPGLITPPRLVGRGDLVTLESQDGEIRVSDQGVALADGQQGARVRVRNSRSRQEIEGIVAGPGLVRVD